MAQKQKIQNLYNLLPKFQHDRDELWQEYLPEKDNAYLKRARNDFHRFKEEEEELKGRMRQHTTGSVGHTTLKRELAEKRRELDGIVTILMRKVPILKMQADQARTSHVDMDVDETGMILTNFLPSHLVPEKPVPDPPVRARPPKQTAKQPSQEQPASTQPSEPPRDTYLDGVKPRDRDIMSRMRILAEKYDCRDKILIALNSIRDRDLTVTMLDELRQMGGKKTV